MKRKNAIVMFLLAAVMLLTACGPQGGTSTSVSSDGGEASSEETGASNTGEVTTITVWTKDRHDQEVMMAIVDELNAKYDDMKVVYEMYTDNYPNTVDIAATTGELPDILCLTAPVIESVSSRNMFYYLDDLIPADMMARFDKSLFMEGINMQDGKIFTLPDTGTALRLVYNKDIFARVGLDAPPKTLDEMVEYSKKITKELSGEGIYGFALPMKNPTSGFRRGFTSITQLSGFPVYEGFDFSTGEYDFTSYVPALEAFKDIFTSGAAFPGCESLDIDPLRTQFADGKIGMYMTYNHSEWGVYTAQFPTEQEWGYAILPTYDGKITGSQKLSAGWWYGITTNCKEPEKAWRVLEAFYNKDNQVAYYEKGLGVTVLQDVQASAKKPESIEYLPAMAIQPTDKVWPKEPNALTVEGNDWGTVFGAYVFGQSKDIDSQIKDLNERYNAAYKKSIADGGNVEVKYPNFKASDPAGTAN